MLIMSVLVLLVYSVQVCATIDMDIDVKSEFFVDDNISFIYSITSDVSENITYMVNVRCLNAPVMMLEEKTAALEAGLPLREEHVYLKLTDWIEPQECSAYLTIFEPVQKTISKNFTLQTNPSFSFDVILDEMIFVINQNISIDYNSEVESPLITATLTYPDKSIKDINLPYSFKADQIGTYELQVTASKEGYKTISLNEQFGVIEGEADISYVDVGETSFSVESNLIYYLIGGGVVLVILFTIYLIIRRKRRENFNL